jgi:predicted dehydrogenase
MNKIKFAVVGFGNIGKRHVQHIMNNERAQLVAICDEKPIEENIEGVNYFKSLEAMLQNESIDVVNVCTPNYLHHPHTILSLQYKKHVVCEKPMAISVVQCDEMIKAAAEHDRTIFVVKQNRFNEPVQQVKKLMHENVLGNIYFININCFWNRNEYYYNESNWRGKKALDGGCLFTQFSHFIDILYYLFGEIKNVKGLMKNFKHAYTEVEDSGSFVMETINGAIVNFNFSTCSYEKNMEGAITILAENGTVKIGGQYLNTIEYQHIKGVQLPEINIVAKSNDYGKYQGSMSNHDKIIANVINTLQGKDTIMTNATEGMHVVKIIEEMYCKSV